MPLMNKSNTSNKKIKGYTNTFEKYGDSPKSLQWAGKNAAEVRYRELVSDLDFENKSILDVGCGMGGVIDYIKKKTKKINYTGIDLVQDFIKSAREKYPKYKFIVGDYFNDPQNKKYDIVMTSGTLNSGLDDLKYKKQAIKTMFENTKEAVVFNMAGNFPKPRNGKRVKYVDSKKILDYCFTLTNKLIFRHHYHNKDFTIVLFKKV